MLRFENLGNPADDWVGRGLSEVLKPAFGADRMPRAAVAAPGLSAERLLAISSGATRLISGYYRVANGQMEVTAIAEDAVTQKIAGPFHASGTLGAAAASLATQLGGAPISEALARSPALKEYALAGDAPLASSVPHYQLALEADPQFGPAYVALARALVAAKEPNRAQEVLAAAAPHSVSFTKEDRAYLQLEAANLSHDANARVAALAAVNSLGTKDAAALQALAEAEMAARKPSEAAQHLTQAAAMAPEDPNLRNALAYAAMAAGDESTARAAAAVYKRLRPEDPNAFDTEGDIEFGFSRWAKAESAYLASPDARFQEYSPTWKSARARLMAGDAAGANAVFEKHRTALRSADSPIAGYRAAEWQFLTGHRAEAASALARFAQNATQPELRSAAWTQAAIWAIELGDRSHAAEWSTAALRPAVPSTVFFAALARFLSQSAASPDEWRRRAETQIKVESGAANAAETRRLALGLALLLSRSFADAVPVWQQIYESSNANDLGPGYLYGWVLLETGRKAEAAPLFRLNPLPSARITPSFEGLYLPALLEWRKASLRQ